MLRQTHLSLIQTNRADLNSVVVVVVVVDAGERKLWQQELPRDPLQSGNMRKPLKMIFLS